MKIQLVDFEKVIKSYKPYSLGVQKMELDKNSHIEKMEPIRKEMENIIATAKSNLIIDEAMQKNSIERFKNLQQEAMSCDNEFKMGMSKFQEELLKKTYENLTNIISEYGKENGIDLILSKSEAIYASNNFDITNTILDLLKNKDLYQESI